MHCRALLLTGDYFLGGVVAGALTKLLLRLRKSTNADAMEVNKLTAEAMLYIVSILRLGESQASLHPRDDDAVDRMVTCLKVTIPFLHCIVTCHCQCCNDAMAGRSAPGGYVALSRWPHPVSCRCDIKDAGSVWLQHHSSGAWYPYAFQAYVGLTGK